MSPTPSTSKNVVLFVVISLAVFCMTALAGTIFLIQDGADAALIAIVSGQGTTALGALAAVLVSTKSDPVAEAQAAQVKAGNVAPPVHVEADVQVAPAPDPLAGIANEANLRQNPEGTGVPPA